MLDEIINYLLTNSSLNIEDNKMDAFIIEVLKQHFSDLNIKGLELKMKKINKIKFYVWTGNKSENVFLLMLRSKKIKFAKHDCYKEWYHYFIYSTNFASLWHIKKMR